MFKSNVSNVFYVNLLSTLEKVKNNFILQKYNRQHFFAVVGYFLVGKYDGNCRLPPLIKMAETF